MKHPAEIWTLHNGYCATLRNKNKPWFIEKADSLYTIMPERRYYQPTYWHYNGSYKTFDAVVDAWVQFTKQYGKGKMVGYRIGFTNFEK